MRDTYVPCRSINCTKLPSSLRVHVEILNLALWMIDYSYFGDCNEISENENGFMAFTPPLRQTLSRLSLDIAGANPDFDYYPSLEGGLDCEDTIDEEEDFSMGGFDGTGKARFQAFVGRLKCRNINPNHVKDILSKAYRMGCFPPDIKLKPRIGFCIEVIHFMNYKQYCAEVDKRSVKRQRVAA